MSRDLLFALVTVLAYFGVVIFVIFNVSNNLGESVTEQRYLVLLILGSVVVRMMNYYLVKNQQAEDKDDSEGEYRL